MSYHKNSVGVGSDLYSVDLKVSGIWAKLALRLPSLQWIPCQTTNREFSHVKYLFKNYYKWDDLEVAQIVSVLETTLRWLDAQINH